MSPVLWIVLLGYLSLAVELIVFPVPSVVSTAKMAQNRSRRPVQRLGHALRGLITGAFLFLPLALVLVPKLDAWTLPLIDSPPPALLIIGAFCMMAAAG